MCCVLLRLSLLLFLHFAADATQIRESSNDEFITRNAGRLNLNDRVSKLEAHNHHQDKEIGNLKNTIVEERKVSHQLRGRVAKLEESNDNLKIIERHKRPYRLLPPHIARGKKNETIVYEALSQFYGPATGCNDLAKLGYTLNGYYLVNDKESQSLDNKYTQIQVVQCRFRKPPGEIQTATDDAEKRVGFIRTYEESKSTEIKNTCIYQLKNHLNMCLVAADRNKGDGSNSYVGSVLRLLPCKSITEKYEQWTRKGMHICSSRNNKCITIAISFEEQSGSTVNLMAYEESSTNQQWMMNFTTNGNAGSQSAQISLFGTNNNKICLYDPTDAYTSLDPRKKIYSSAKTKAVLLPQQCEESSKEQRFFFEPTTGIHNNPQNCTIEYAYYVKRNKKNNN